MATGFVTALNRFALVVALAMFAAIGAWWWRDRTRTYERPHWPDARMAALVAPGAGADSARWIVAVNPDCPACRRRLAELRGEGAAALEGAALGVLLVDVRARPDSVVLGPGLEAGVWWDSLGTWRSRWGHRLYGETMVFGSGGALTRVISPNGEAAAAAR